MNEQAEHYRRILREQLPTLTDQYGVESLALFGSRIRGDAVATSDLDILVSFHESPSLLRLIELENELTDLLGVKVDLVLRNALKPRIGQRILAEATPV